MSRTLLAKIPTSEVIEFTATDLYNGLKSEAVTTLRKKHGLNKLEEEEKVRGASFGLQLQINMISLTFFILFRST